MNARVEMLKMTLLCAEKCLNIFLSQFFNFVGIGNAEYIKVSNILFVDVNQNYIYYEPKIWIHQHDITEDE